MSRKKKYTKKPTTNFEAAVVVGCSAGGIQALGTILKKINRTLKSPILVVQHISPKSDSYLVNIFQKLTSMHVKVAEDKDQLEASTLYLAPPNYHLLVGEDFSLSLSVDERVSFARPSIDVLFETAAYAFRDKLVAVILTGANEDGIEGMKKIKAFGGTTLVQNPATATAECMPKAAIEQIDVDEILTLDEIADYISKNIP